MDRGFENALFRRRAADDLVVSVYDRDEAALQAEEGGDETKTPTVASSFVVEPFRRAEVGRDSEATIILGNLHDGAAAANSLSACPQGFPSGPLTTSGGTPKLKRRRKLKMERPRNATQSR